MYYKVVSILIFNIILIIFFNILYNVNDMINYKNKNKLMMIILIL